MSKFMPPKPEIFANNDYYEPTLSKRDFNNWYDTHIKPLFENAVEVHLHRAAYSEYYISESSHTNETHTGLLINIQPIKPQGAEDILREIVHKFGKCDRYNSTYEELIEKARKFLEKK